MTVAAYAPLLGIAELAANLDDPRLRIFDATVFLRRPPEGGPYTPESGRAYYEDAHIPGAGFADVLGALADPSAPHPFALPTAARFAAAIGALGVGPGTHVVAYAQENQAWATRLWWLLRYFGFDDVSVLDGSLGAWREAGHPTSDGSEAYPADTFAARPRPELLATRADVEAVLAGGSACLVNALPEAAFRGEGASAYSRPGRIPGSVSVPWRDLVDPDSGRFGAPEAMARRLDAAGARADAPVIAYCGGGIAATVDVFALALLGRDDVRLYDGSLTEWTADLTLPVEVG